jgi:hypothetical protein
VAGPHRYADEARDGRRQATLDQGRLKTDGGFVRLNKIIDGKLEGLLGEQADEVWVDAG